MPGALPAAGCRVTSPTLRPAPDRAAVAAAWDWPVTSGTLTGAGPLETSTVTALPTLACPPAAGSVPITWPAATVSLLCDWATGWKPRPRSAAKASRRVRPATAGRVALPGPEDTSMVTAEPLATLVPPRGFSAITVPGGQVALLCGEDRGLSPLRLSTAEAVFCGWQRARVGTVTCELWPSRSTAATAAASRSTTTAAAIHHRRRPSSGSSGGTSGSSTGATRSPAGSPAYGSPTGGPTGGGPAGAPTRAPAETRRVAEVGVAPRLRRASSSAAMN